PILGAPVSHEVYEELLRSYDEGVAEFLELDRVKPNTLGNTRMLLRLEDAQGTTPSTPRMGGRPMDSSRTAPANMRTRPEICRLRRSGGGQVRGSPTRSSSGRSASRRSFPSCWRRPARARTTPPGV